MSAVRSIEEDYPDVVALTGAAGSGKSTACGHLRARGYTLVKFAGPLKAMCRAIGMTECQIEGVDKEVPSERLAGKSPRQFMQLLGTEFGRDLIGPTFWTSLWSAEVERVLKAGGRVVVDDCRFPNEADAVRRFGGDIYRLIGRGGIAGTHVSEGQRFPVDTIISNIGSKQQLFDTIDTELARWG